VIAKIDIAKIMGIKKLISLLKLKINIFIFARNVP